MVAYISNCSTTYVFNPFMGLHVHAHMHNVCIRAYAHIFLKLFLPPYTRVCIYIYIYVYIYTYIYICIMYTHEAVRRLMKTFKVDRLTRALSRQL